MSASSNRIMLAAGWGLVAWGWWGEVWWLSVACLVACGVNLSLAAVAVFVENTR